MGAARGRGSRVVPGSQELESSTIALHPLTRWPIGGRHEPWVRPLVLTAQNRRDEALTILRTVPDPLRPPPRDAVVPRRAHAALALGDRDSMQRAYTALTPAEAEIAGAGTGLFTLGPVSRYLQELAEALST